MVPEATAIIGSQVDSMAVPIPVIMTVAAPVLALSAIRLVGL